MHELSPQQAIHIRHADLDEVVVGPAYAGGGVGDVADRCRGHDVHTPVGSRGDTTPPIYLRKRSRAIDSHFLSGMWHLG